MSATVVGTKKCSKCNTVKTPSEFHKRKSRKIGVAPHCKGCDKKRKYNGVVLDSKKCNVCHLVKGLGEFHKSKNGGHGRMGLCRECRSKKEYTGEMNDKKECSACKKIRSLSEFHKQRAGRYGRQAKCKLCMKDHDKKRIYKGVSISEKVCSVCGKEKELSEYHKDKKCAGGVAGQCKSCYTQYRRENSEAFRQRVKKYQENPKNKRKKEARRAVERAVIRQELPNVKTLRCSHCEKQAYNYHHWSYEKDNWLDVVPLCSSCHRMEHLRLKSEGAVL